MATESTAGQRRLRRVAKVCEGYGQRVQKSVFECVVNAGEFEQLKHKLKLEVDEKQDSLRVYRLREPREHYLEVIGREMFFDIHDPLVL